MVKKVLFPVLVIIVSYLPVDEVYSQSALQTFSGLTSEAAIQYSQPAITAFSSGMNSGWFSGLPSSTNSFHMKLRIIGVGSSFSDQRTFSTVAKFNFTSEQIDDILSNSGLSPSIIQNYEEIRNELLAQLWEVNISGPTINGSRDDYLEVEFPGYTVTAEFQGGNTQEYEIEPQSVTVTEVTGLLNNMELLPTPAIQLDLSSVLGTGVSFRYFTGMQLENVGKINIYGAGISHNINYWFEETFPIDVGFGYYFQRFTVGDIFSNSTSQFGLYISKQFGMIVSFVPYVSLTSESSQTNIKYNYTFDTPVGPQDLNIEVDHAKDNLIAIIVGFSLNFPVLSFNVDYKISETQTGTVGIGFGF